MSPQITGKTINKGDTIEMRLRITVNSLTCPLPPLLNFKYTCGSTIHPIRCHIPFTMFNLLQRIKSSASTCSTIFKNFTKELSTTFKLSSSSFKQRISSVLSSPEYLRIDQRSSSRHPCYSLLAPLQLQLWQEFRDQNKSK